jgi:hypothetical protein
MLRVTSSKRPLNGRSFHRLRAVLAGGLAGIGLILSLAGPSTASAARVRLPTGIAAPPGGVIKLPPGPTSPGVYPLQASASAVTVRWYDRSSNEQKFVVYRRDQYGAWHSVDQVPTRNMADDSGDYTYVDSDRSLSGQCYVIAAVNADGGGYTQEQCTVRPDPSRFPQTVPSSAQQWYGLSDANDGTGDLQNDKRSSYTSLTHANQTFGVDLGWSENGALWRIEAQGGPHLMRGQAVALRVWGGGWLKYSNQTWGVDVGLSDTPVYQWYVLGGQPGSSIAYGSDFALWNSAANAYLVSQHQTWGVSLGWYKQPGGSTGTVHNASVTMIAQPPVQGYVPFLGYFGGGAGNTAVLTQGSNSPYGATLFFIKPGHQSSECGNSSAVITLPPGATMTAAQMQTLYGSATPSLSHSIPFLACAATNYSSVTVNVQYRDH